MKPIQMLAAVASAALLASVSACGSGGSSSTGGSAGGAAGGSTGGSVNIGVSTSLTGSIASFSQSGMQGIQLAVSDLNAGGGILGKKVKVVSADDNLTPATGASNMRSMITNDHVVAMFGPVASSIASAEEQLAAQYKVPIFFHMANDSSLMTKTFTPYAFQIVPNTVMEPRAVADYLAQKIKKGKPITVGTFAPDYSFGHDTVSGFLKALDDLHVNYKVVKQEFPPLAATNIGSYLSALVAAKPDYVFNAQYGGDLDAFTKQAESYGFFKHTTVIGMYGYLDMKALGSQSPAGAIGFDRAPFWAIKNPQMATFVKNYKAKYGDYPSTWATLGYAAVQQWAWGTKKAGSFDGTKLTKVLPGTTPPTILGKLQIRACDHQTETPEYVGTISKTGNSKYNGVHLFDDPMFKAPFDQIALTCAQVKALQP
ncbi:ABC transporter substrate-binding protein [Leekyejoonella antrihumi]|uniref:Leucine-binding protein domain-containing protein n=1 Tax=Leekyejoonella antrihumi TaxID=1660198 RepID=A0A563E706_9MICO|nr:ABC transporter substrate-binding protein [Leekyejoonella antrihumi]TWP38043.1 hypothetical protein FGL98_04885 [Leekyejoonella antrihumi]